METSTSPIKNKTSVLFRWLTAMTTLGMLALGATWYWKQNQDEQQNFVSATVTRGDLIQVVTATGQLNPLVTVQVGSQISGMIEKLLVDFNSPVKQGDVIAQIDPSIYKANVAQAEGELAHAKAALELAKTNRDRAQKLFERGAAPQATLDKAGADYEQALASVKIRTGALEKATADLAHCTIYAPIDGIVISRNVDVGQTVAASLSAPTLFVIANDLKKMQINANVAEADIGSVEPGQEVRFTVDAFPHQTFQGKIIQIRNSPITIQNVVTYDTVIDVDNSELKLKPGMTANVSMIVARRNNVLRIPNAALRVQISRDNDDSPPQNAGHGSRQILPSLTPAPLKTVYTLTTNGTAKSNPIQVRTGISDGVFTEVLEGLQEGDRIITGTTADKRERPRSDNPLTGSMRRYLR